MASGFSKIKDWLDKEKFTFFLVCLLLYAIAAPFFSPVLRPGLFLNISFTAVLATAVFSVSNQKNNLLMIIIITVPCLVLVWIELAAPNEEFLIVETILKLLFHLIMLFFIIGYIFRTRHVSRDTISAALIGYILLALVWTNLYLLLELLSPNSFNIEHAEIIANPAVFIYFSFVTMTTLGYGDVTPITSQAGNLAILEALIGQMYMAVLIARLVGLQAAQFFERKNK